MGAVLLRPYQLDAVDATFAAWEHTNSVLGVAATGLGKTILFASIVARHPGRCFIVAHREELIFQAAQKVKWITGVEPDIEMAEIRANEHGLLGKARVVIGTIQTQTGGSSGGRMYRFDPREFELLVIDEAHHAVADSYRRMIRHYTSNPNLRVLGVTATPDRADEQALGQVFQSVAWEYDIRFGIDDGWLVPVVQQLVHVEGLDLSSVRTTAGDLNGADLARIMEYEKNLHEIAAPTIELTRSGQKTLVFAASVAHAERLCEILNRHRAGCANWVHGGTPKTERRAMFSAYAKGEYQYLVNVGVATEGFDDPGIEVIVMARPTKSRALYAQMLGRGTRPLPGIVDDPDMFGSPAMRRGAINASPKTHVEIVDFVGNSGRHRLVTTADILAGKYTDAVIERAREQIEKSGRGNTLDALDEAERQLRDEAERAREQAAARRAGLVISANYRTTQLNPFDVFGLTPWRERGWDKGREPSSKMLDLLERAGIKTRELTFTQAKQLISELIERNQQGKCTFKQARLLRSRGLSADVTRQEATRLIDEIAAREGWARTQTAGEFVRY